MNSYARSANHNALSKIAIFFIFWCAGRASWYVWLGLKHNTYWLGIIDDFMTSDSCRKCISNISTYIQSSRQSQLDIDDMYKKMCECIYSEMKEKNPTYSPGRHVQRRGRKYWNEELSSLWNEMCLKDKLFSKFRGARREKTKLLTAFKMSRSKFDKTLRQYDRAHKRSIMLNIEAFFTDTSNLRNFWDHFKS